MKQLKDYIHLYLYCTVVHIPDDGTTATLIGIDQGRALLLNNDHNQYGECSYDKIKPILRPLSDMTEEEAKEIGWWDDWDNRIAYAKDFKEDWMFSSSNMLYLLDKGFDIFGLIDAGLAINAKDTQNQTNNV